MDRLFFLARPALPRLSGGGLPLRAGASSRGVPSARRRLVGGEPPRRRRRDGSLRSRRARLNGHARARGPRSTPCARRPGRRLRRRRLRHVRLGGPGEELVEAREHLAQRPPHLASGRCPPSSPACASAGSPRLPRRAGAGARRTSPRSRDPSPPRSIARGRGHLCPNGQYTSRNVRGARRDPASGAVPVGGFAVSMLQPSQLGDDRRRAAPRALRVLEASHNAPHRATSSARRSRNTPLEQPRRRLVTRDGPRGIAGARRDLERVSPSSTRAQPVAGFSVRVSLVDVRLPRPRRRRPRERGKVIRRERRVAIGRRRCQRAGCRSMNRPPNAASTASGDPTRPAKAQLRRRAWRSPPSRKANRVGSSSTSSTLRSMCCEARASSAPQSGAFAELRSREGCDAARKPRDLPCDHLAGSAAQRGAGRRRSLSRLLPLRRLRRGGDVAQHRARGDVVVGAHDVVGGPMPRAGGELGDERAEKASARARFRARALSPRRAVPPAPSPASPQPRPRRPSPGSRGPPPPPPRARPPPCRCARSTAPRAARSTSPGTARASGATRFCSLVWFALAHFAPSNS